MVKVAIIFLMLSLQSFWANQFEMLPILSFFVLFLIFILMRSTRKEVCLYATFPIPLLTLKPAFKTHPVSRVTGVSLSVIHEFDGMDSDYPKNDPGYYQLGEKYYHGLGVKRNDDLAVFYYKKSAKNGHFQSQYLLGLLYYYGTSIKQDKNIALYWLNQAAENDHAPAQFFLGFLYQYGLGVPKNTNEGLRWIKLAADQEYNLAQEFLTRLELKFLP